MDALKAYISLFMIFGGLLVVLLSPLYSIILNFLVPAKPIYKTNSSMIHRDTHHVRLMRKRHNSKVALFGFSMSTTGFLLIVTAPHMIV